MGYYTTYKLSWEPPKPEVEIYLEAQQSEDESFCYGVMPDGSSSDSVKWYDYETDVKKLSKQFPDVTFLLTGEGEESGDIWAMRFKDGKSERAETKIEIKFKDGTVVDV